MPLQVGRQRDLVEEELSTLAATLGRVNEDKNHLEKELAAEQRQAQGLQNQFDALNVSHHRFRTLFRSFSIFARLLSFVSVPNFTQQSLF